MAEVLGNSPTAGTRAALGEVSGTLPNTFTPGEKVKLKAAVPLNTGLRVAGEHLVVVDNELIRIKTTAAAWTEAEIVAREVEESTIASHAEGAKIYSTPSKEALRKWLAGQLSEIGAEAVGEPSKIVLSNVVLKTGTQTITGQKTFAFPAPSDAEVGTGEAGENGLLLTPGHGQNTTKVEGTVKGGEGGQVTYTGGAGGTALSGTNKPTGGVGGTINLAGGPGGAAGTTNTITAKGGTGGPCSISGGSGGPGQGSGTGTRTGGAGGPATIAGGGGGEGTAGETLNGGNGGSANLIGGKGGNGATKVGKGGVAKVEGGEQTFAATSTAGDAEITGGIGLTDAVSGHVYIKTGGSRTERIKVTNEGVTEIKGRTVLEGFDLAAPVPLEVTAGATYKVPANAQVLWSSRSRGGHEINVQGTMNVQGLLTDVG